MVNLNHAISVVLGKTHKPRVRGVAVLDGNSGKVAYTLCIRGLELVVHDSGMQWQHGVLYVSNCVNRPRFVQDRDLLLLSFLVQYIVCGGGRGDEGSLWRGWPGETSGRR